MVSISPLEVYSFDFKLYPLCDTHYCDIGNGRLQLSRGEFLRACPENTF